jgi:hypothetical protein
MVDRDLSLWRSWRERSDGDAFGSLVRPHVEFATRLARRTGLAAADAEDVVQRSLIRLAAEPTDKPARVGLRAWIGRSVVNETRMFFRARRRRAEHEANALRQADAASDPVEARDEVDRALSELDGSSNSGTSTIWSTARSRSSRAGPRSGHGCAFTAHSAGCVDVSDAEPRSRSPLWPRRHRDPVRLMPRLPVVSRRSMPGERSDSGPRRRPSWEEDSSWARRRKSGFGRWRRRWSRQDSS